MQQLGRRMAGGLLRLARASRYRRHNGHGASHRHTGAHVAATLYPGSWPHASIAFDRFTLSFRESRADWRRGPVPCTSQHIPASQCSGAMPPLAVTPQLWCRNKTVCLRYRYRMYHNASGVGGKLSSRPASVPGGVLRLSGGNPTSDAFSFVAKLPPGSEPHDAAPPTIFQAAPPSRPSSKREVVKSALATDVPLPKPPSSMVGVPRRPPSRPASASSSIMASNVALLQPNGNGNSGHQRDGFGGTKVTLSGPVAAGGHRSMQFRTSGACHVQTACGCSWCSRAMPWQPHLYSLHLVAQCFFSTVLALPLALNKYGCSDCFSTCGQ